MIEYIRPIKRIEGEILVPGDKSISHRALIFSAIAEGESHIYNLSMGEDCFSTIKCLEKLGVAIEFDGERAIVYGKGLYGLKEPNSILDVGNSGTTIRLLMGLLVGQNFNTTITGDASILTRPMDRVILPLKQMGASIIGENNNKTPPITVFGANLVGMDYEMTVASAQVKTAILLASLYAKGDTKVLEKVKTRDHSEIMLNYMGAHIKTENQWVINSPVSKLMAKDITVPSDISCAAFFIVAALLLPYSEITIRNLLFNPTRTGLITVLMQMGGDIEIRNERIKQGELLGDITVKSSTLKPTKISGAIIPTMIDEIPILAVAALFAKGETTIEDVEELRYKESNRIKVLVTELSKMGGNIREIEGGIAIRGRCTLKGAAVESHNDHRIAMSLAIAGVCAEGETVINNSKCIDVSFPNFFEILEKLQ